MFLKIFFNLVDLAERVIRSGGVKGPLIERKSQKISTLAMESTGVCPSGYGSTKYEDRNMKEGRMGGRGESDEPLSAVQKSEPAEKEGGKYFEF